ENLRGYTFGIFRLEDVVPAAFAKLDQSGIRLLLVQEAQGRGPESTLYASLAPPTRPAQRERSVSHIFDFGGQRYRLDMLPDDTRGEQSWQVWLVLGVGLLFARVIGVATLMTAGRAARATFARRTRALEQRARGARAPAHARAQPDAQRT